MPLVIFLFLKFISDSLWWVWPWVVSSRRSGSPSHFLTPPPQHDSRRKDVKCNVKTEFFPSHLFSLLSHSCYSVLHSFLNVFSQRHHLLCCWRSSLWLVAGPFWSQLEPTVTNIGWAPDLFSEKLPQLPKPCHIKKKIHPHIYYSDINLYHNLTCILGMTTQHQSIYILLLCQLKILIMCLHTRFISRCTCGTVGNWI